MPPGIDLAIVLTWKINPPTKTKQRARTTTHPTHPLLHQNTFNDIATLSFH